jgi:hypothetical protein
MMPFQANQRRDYSDKKNKPAEKAESRGRSRDFCDPEESSAQSEADSGCRAKSGTTSEHFRERVPQTGRQECQGAHRGDKQTKQENNNSHPRLLSPTTRSSAKMIPSKARMRQWG